MKPSERIKEIALKNVPEQWLAQTETAWLRAIIQYLDEQAKVQEEFLEPEVVFATIRPAEDDIGDREWQIECRMADGQKFAPIVVDGEFPELAQRICDFLNGEK